MSVKQGEKQRLKNQSVKKLFSIIEVMARSSTSMRLQDIAESIHIPPSTALRFLNTLIDLDYVYQDVLNHRYCLTMKLTHIGNQIASKISVRDVVRPFLIELAEKCEETACFAVERDYKVIYLDVVDYSSYSLCFIQRPGACAPMYCTGIGKLLLSNKTETELKNYFIDKKPDYYTENTKATLSELSKDLENIRTQGYSIDNEEYTEGVISIAAPIKDYNGKITYGISIAGPSSRLNEKKAKIIIPELIETANKISNVLGTIDDHPH
ncbi:MAG: IclR family transcriptional regulator [Anaerovoracaceae bacterium]